MAARVSKVDKELFAAFLEKMRDGTWIGMPEDNVAEFGELAAGLVEAKIRDKNANAKARAKKSEEAKKVEPQLPEAPKKKRAKEETPEPAASEEKPAAKLVEGRRYEALGNAKLGNAILEFLNPHSKEADKGTFKVLFQGEGSIPEGKKVSLPNDKVKATRRAVPKSKAA